MARYALAVTLGASLGEGRFSTTVVGKLPVDAATLTTDAAPVAAAMAVLVADGASPTQAHVNTANAAYTTLAADIVAVNTAASGDLLVTYDAAVVTSITKLKRAFGAALQAAINSGILTD